MLTPDADEARRWAEEELGKAIYDDSPTLVERIIDWFGHLLDRLGELGGSAPPALVPVLVVLLVAVVVAVALLLGGRVRRRRVRAAAASAALFDGTRSAAELTARADAAARRRDYATAVVERFRAIIRDLDERAVLEDRPGLTAHEAVLAAGAALPDAAVGLARGGRLFDDARYGHAVPDQSADAELRALAEHVARLRAVHGPLTASTPAGWGEVR